MLKHIEDDGDLAVLANDAGAVLLVCETCKRRWVVQGAPGAREAPSGAGAESVLETLRAHPDVLAGSPVSLDDLG